MNKTSIGFVVAGLLIASFGFGLLIQHNQNAELTRRLSRLESEPLTQSQKVVEQSAVLKSAGVELEKMRQESHQTQIAPASAAPEPEALVESSASALEKAKFEIVPPNVTADRGQRIYVFPQLVNAKREVVLTNAEFRTLAGRRLTFRAAEGPRAFDVDELHPGILAYLDIDPESVKQRYDLQKQREKIQQMADSAAKAQALRRPPLPEIFRSIPQLEAGASQISGYDPNNPPRLRTLNPQQELALNPFQREQYLTFIHERGQKIITARERYESLVALGENAALEEYLSEKRKAAIDAETASSTLAKAGQEKQKANAAKFEADKKLAGWQKDLNAAIAKGWFTLDAGTKIIKPSAPFSESPETVKMADRLNTVRPDIDKEVAQTTKAKAEADAEWELAAKLQVEQEKAAVYRAERFRIAEEAMNERRKVQAAERQAASAASAVGAANRQASAAASAAGAANRQASAAASAADAANRAANAAESTARSIEMQRLMPAPSQLQLEPTKVRIVP